MKYNNLSILYLSIIFGFYFVFRQYVLEVQNRVKKIKYCVVKDNFCLTVECNSVLFL